MALLLDGDQRERKREIGRGRNEREEVREGRKQRVKEVQDKDVWKEKIGEGSGKTGKELWEKRRMREERGVEKVRWYRVR